MAYTNNVTQNYMKRACGEPFDEKYEDVFKLADSIQTTCDAAILAQTLGKSEKSRLSYAIHAKKRFKWLVWKIHESILSTHASLLVFIDLCDGKPDLVSDFDPLIVKNGRCLYTCDFKNGFLRSGRSVGRKRDTGDVIEFARCHPAYVRSIIIDENFGKFVKMDSTDPDNCIRLMRAGMTSTELRNLNVPPEKIHDAEIACGVPKEKRLKFVSKKCYLDDVTGQVTESM